MKESHFIVDRIEDRSLVLQNRNAEIIIIDKKNVEDEVQEGDILLKVSKNKYVVNKNETDNRKTTLFLQLILIDYNGNFGRGMQSTSGFNNT